MSSEMYIKDSKHIDQKTVSQAIDAMVQADPQLAQLKEAEQREDADWHMVQEVYDSWKYSNSGLGATPSLATTIVAAIYLGPMYGAMASNLAVGTINNGGDLGEGLQQAISADSLGGYTVAMATAYLVSPQLDRAFGVSSDNVNKVTKGFKLSTVEGIGGFATYSITQGFVQSVMQQTAYGGSYIDSLDSAMAGQVRNLGMTVGFSFIGDSVKYLDGSPPKIMAHAPMGGLLVEASGSDFKTGATTAGTNEAMISLLGKMVGGDRNLELMASQLVSITAASAISDDVSLGAEIAKSGAAYNRQLHPDEIRFASDVERIECYAQENELSEDIARKELLNTAAMMVDNGWNQALTGTSINATRAAQYLRTELDTGPGSNLFRVTQADYYNERVGLTALFKDKEVLTSVLESITLANPASRTRDPAGRAEVLNAKGKDNQAGFGPALEGVVNTPSRTALWLMGVLTCLSCTERNIQNAWNSVASLPENIRTKGYLDALHIMQGQGVSVVRDNAASSVALGVEVGLAIDGELVGAGKGVVTDGAKGTGEVTNSGGRPTVELLGGQKAQTPGTVSVDVRPDIQSGIRTDVTKLPFRDNLLGGVVTSSPFTPKSAGGTSSMMDFLPEATRVIGPGGKVFVNANTANPYGEIPSASELEPLGLRIIQDGLLDSRFSGQTFLHTDGSVVTNLDSMKIIALEEIK